jgi:signal transduction histidine kinase
MFVVPLVLLTFLGSVLIPIDIRAAGIPSKKNALTIKEVGLFHVIRESSFPEASTSELGEPSLWRQAKWIWISGLLIILTLFGLILYMRFSRQQLKLARDRLANLSGMLISAEERERSRLAAELHDDFSQRLAVLSLKLQTAADALPSCPEEANRRLCDLQNAATEIGADLHALSHRLHSSTLERLGLLPGIRALCREFSTQQAIEVSFMSDPIPESVPPDTALCLFRIVQEGLRNLKKHSGVETAKVTLRAVGEKLRVSVCDRGVGFDLKELRTNEGLGIQSMENRARFLGGHFAIHSAPGLGTSIDAWVPVRHNHDG